MKLINHVLDIRRLIQQAFDNRFSRMGLRMEAATPVEQIPSEHHWVTMRRHVRQPSTSVYLRSSTASLLSR